MLSDQLIPISTIARAGRVSKIHLAYLTKLRLLPQTIRRKVNGKITGCYPEGVLTALREIEDLKERGLTYSQIRYEMHKDDRNLSSNFYPQNTIFNLQSSIVFLAIGLILGYILSVVNTINSNAKTAAVATVPPGRALWAAPENTTLTVKQPPQNDPVYIIAVPQKNLYKLGSVDLKL